MRKMIGKTSNSNNVRFDEMPDIPQFESSMSRRNRLDISIETINRATNRTSTGVDNM